MGVRGVAVMAALVIAGFVVGVALVGGGPGVKRPRGVPADAPYVDGLVQVTAPDRIVVKPNGGGRPVPLAVTLQHAGLVDVPHLVNFHQARSEPVRVYFERRGAARLPPGGADPPRGPGPPPPRG